MPKEMMPIFSNVSTNKKIVLPLLQYVYEQLYSMNFRDYCFVVGREKRSIEDHFTPHEMYLRDLKGDYKSVMTKFYHKLENSHLVWINQNKPLGFGDAVKRSERYVGKEDFIVHAGDVTILSRSRHPITRLIDTAKKNPDAKVIGQWAKSNSVKNHVGGEYLYASGPNSKVVYPVKLTKGGKYEVRISFAHHPNRSTKTLVTVRHNDGENAFRINQKKEPAVDGYFQSLGFFEFQAGQWDAVEISAMGGDGAVIADAVQFLPEGTKSSRKKKKSVARKELHQALDDLVDGKLEARHVPHIAWLLKHGKVNLPDELLKSWQSALEGLAKEARWESRLAVSWWGGTGVDEHILERGSPQSPGKRVGRNLPELLAMAPLQNRSPGRLELARQLTAKDHPLTSRVMVNRIWHQLFGRGIVSTPDNFGWLGQRPSHPELLDYLAVEFAETHSHSIKSFIERIVLTKTFGMSSTAADPAYAEKDQDNRWLHRMPLRRLEAEAIRDSALAISGRLDRRVGGKPVLVHLTEFVVGRGSPKKSGPLDGAGRRSIYTALRRNFIPTLMLTFDFPGPFTTMGKRDITNVAGQSLALMNDRFLYGQSGLWARRIIKEHPSAPERIRRMYAEAFARPPSDGELAACLEALTAFTELYGGDPNGHEAWRDLCHSFYSMTDFIYLK